MATYHQPVLRPWAHRSVPYVLFGALAVVILAVVALVVTATDAGVGSGGSSVVTAGATDADAAVSAWTAAHRAEAFPGVTGPFLGACSTVPSGTQGLCTLPREDLGDGRIVGVGVVATDSGVDLLVLPTIDPLGLLTWHVADSAAWPAPGSGSFGPPWSPSTALAAWTATDGTGVFGAGATYVAGCSASGAIAGPDQVLLCGSLVEQTKTQRTYAVGVMGGAPAMRIQLSELGDHTWWVSATQPM